MVRVEIRTVDLLFALFWGLVSGLQAFTRGFNVVEAILGTVTGFLATLGVVLLVRKVKKKLRK